MRDLTTILKEAAKLNLNEHTVKLFDELLQRNLDLEGPPSEPIPGISTDYRSAFIRTQPTNTRPYGTPNGFARTWLTDTWRCLLLDIPSCAMARPRQICHNRIKQQDGTTFNPAIIILDAKSKRFQTQLIAACRCLNLTQTYNEAAISCIIGNNYTFIAWRERQKGETFNAILRGDIDNYTKNCLDGLQKARVINNDRGVFRLIATKSLPENWLTPPRAIEQLLIKEAQKLKRSGVDNKNIKIQLVLSHKQMSEIFDDYQNHKKNKKSEHTKGKGRPSNIQYTTNDIAYAISLVHDHSLRAIQRKTGIPITKLKSILQAQLNTLPKRTGGRPIKKLTELTINRIHSLAQDGYSIAAIQAILKDEAKNGDIETVSIRKLRALLANKI